MKTTHILFASLIAIITLGGCRKNEPAAEPQHIVPLYQAMRDYASLDSAVRAELFAADSTLIKTFMSTVSELPADDELLSLWSESLPVSVFTPPVDSVYPTLEPVEEALGTILARAAADGLIFPKRDYAAVVYGRREAILFVDSTMLIALNHYLGADYPGYNHWPAYMTIYKHPGMLPYDMAEALTATAYPYAAEGSEATLLSRMLYEGALVKAKMELVPDATLEGALGYDERTLEWLARNERRIWQQIVAKHLLYDTSASTIEKLNRPAPMVTMLDEPAPARVGRYIGYKIVDAYCRRHTATLPYLLSPSFYTSPQILSESGY